jgi:outer membrane protein OmpA-like peptidoglycan-associated protein
MRVADFCRNTARAGGVAFGFAIFVCALFSSAPAGAQQKTMYLDRLTVGGAPDDGVAIWRPVTQQRARFFAQAGLGFALNPLRLSTIAPDTSRLRQFSSSPVSTQFIFYPSVGVEVANRVDFIATLPFALFQSGSDPSPAGVTGAGNLEPFALFDLRLDIRAVLFRSDDNRWRLGAGLSFYPPTGAQFSYGGDGGVHTSWNFAAETTIRDLVTLTANTGIHLRPTGVVGELAVGDEMTLGLGGFLPLRGGLIRVGAELFMSTGLESLAGQSRVEESTFFSAKNTPVEWMVEGRTFLDPERQLWVSGNLGTRLDSGYGGPDFRVGAMIGYSASIEDSDANSPAARMKIVRERISRNGGDADHDGIPDDVDLCPSVPEDHLDPDPNDGCPVPPDRDHDGVPDEFDKCPDDPEDRDGIQDMDGCPEVDYDSDGIPDVEDACPREPGSPSKDPKQNGCPQFIKRVTGSTEIQILKQIQFDTGKASIKQSSYAILEEIVKLMRANPDIHRLSIEGHTDDRGSVDMNQKLSQERASSVMSHLVNHGIDAGRIEAHGFGPSKPIDTNDTEIGRQNNRRVEFHILEAPSGDKEKE